ncbi:MAG: VOC family protein [Pirellulales bacterium]
MTTQKIKPFLWFTSQAEEAARFYVSIFPNSEVTRVVNGPGGNAMVVEFRLAGIEFIALNGGPHVQLNEAFSLVVDCEDQAELDAMWETLSEGGSKSRCGWLKDRFGLSWQIVPSILSRLMSDPERSSHVMQTLLEMDKLDIAELQAAYDAV